MDGINNQFIITALSGALVAVLSVALTFLFTMFLSSKNVVQKVEAGVKTHKAIDHQKNIESEIDEHEEGCKARQDYFETKTALVFLVKEAGGNPQQMGLTR